MIPRPRAPHDDTDDPAARAAVTAIVNAARAGDREAFGQVYGLYADTVFRYVYYRVSTRALAEDLTSETFVRALRRIETFQWQGKDFGAWLVTIARNIIADHFKAIRNRMEHVTSDGEMRDAGKLEPSTEDVVLAAITAVTIHDAIADLNPMQRACIQARFLDELTVAQTAARLDRNEGAIKTLQYRAVRSLGRDPRLTPETAA